MKKFFKTTVKILTNTALILIMLIGAQHAMNLPFSWTGLGYLVLFIVGLILLMLFNSNYELYYNEGYNAGWEAKKINGEIFKEINKGEKDEFDIEMENEFAKQYIALFVMGNKFCSDNDEYKYNITCIENLGETSKITFTKINKGE